ncbi:hypothetical protein ESCOMMO158M_22470 [Escherichia coli]
MSPNTLYSNFSSENTIGSALFLNKFIIGVQFILKKS